MDNVKFKLLVFENVSLTFFSSHKTILATLNVIG
jgi:hypothetical protein